MIARQLGLAGFAALLLVTPRPAQAAQVTPVPGTTAPDRALLVTGAGDAPPASSVRVIENGRAVPGVSVAPAGAIARRTPVAIVVSPGRAGARAEARALARTRDVSPAVVTYSGRDVTISAPLGAPRAGQDALAGPVAGPAGVRTLDAVAAAIGQLPDGGTVVVLGDGSDAASTHTAAEVTALARRAGVTVDSVGPAAARVAAETGGVVLRNRSTASTSGLGARLARGYVVSYRSRTRGSARVALSAPGVRAALTFASTTPAAARTPASAGVGAPVIALVLLLLGGAVALVLRTRRAPRGVTDRVGAWIARPDAEAAAAVEAAAVAATPADEPEGSRRRALADTLELAGIAMPVDRLLARVAVAALLAAVAGWVLGGPILALVLAAGAPIAARAWVRSKLAARRKRFATQLADTVQAIAAAMRAGHGLSAALAMVAEDVAEPMASELARAVSSERLGNRLDEALEEVVARMRNRDLEQVALVAALQRDVGGNAAEALDRIVDTVRGRDDLRRMVSALTAQGRLSRWILTGLPIVLALIISVISHGYLAPMVQSLVGIGLSVGAALGVVVGSFLIGRIVEIEV